MKQLPADDLRKHQRHEAHQQKGADEFLDVTQPGPAALRAGLLL